jgi:cysteine desulfurase
MKPRIYLDYAATAPLVPAARGAIEAALAIHEDGRRARDLLERARNQVAGLAGQPREQIVFTSGGTEANALGVATLCAHAERSGRRWLAATTRIEHPSLRGAVWARRTAGWDVRWLEVRPDTAIVTIDDPLGVVAISAVNHELGTCASTDGGGLESVVSWARDRGALVHVDAVQAAGKVDLAPITALADTVAISAHKIGGPQGVGALIVRGDLERGAGDATSVDRGHQERGRRPGTENVLGIVGFGAAAAVVDITRWPAVAALGERLETGLRTIDGARIHGEAAPRIGGTVNAGFAGALGESIVIALDLAGVSVSTGAACTSGSVQPSQVLLGLGMSPDHARQAVRFSLGVGTTEADIDAVLGLLPAIVSRARR